MTDDRILRIAKAWERFQRPYMPPSADDQVSPEGLREARIFEAMLDAATAPAAAEPAAPELVWEYEPGDAEIKAAMAAYLNHPMFDGAMRAALIAAAKARAGQ